MTFVSSLVMISAAATELPLTLYPADGDLLCNDGTPSGYYFRPAPDDANDQER